MPLEEMTCKRCGSALKTDTKTKFAECEYCGTFYKITDIINEKLQQMEKEEENKKNKVEEYEQELERARVFQKLGYPDKAWSIYKYLMDNYPGDYRAYEKCWRMKPCLENRRIYNSMIILCPEKEKEYGEHYASLRQKEREAEIAEALQKERYNIEMERSKWNGCGVLFLIFTVIFAMPTIYYINRIVNFYNYIELPFLIVLSILTISFFVASIAGFKKGKKAKKKIKILKAELDKHI